MWSDLGWWFQLQYGNVDVVGCTFHSKSHFLVEHWRLAVVECVSSNTAKTPLLPTQHIGMEMLQFLLGGSIVVVVVVG